MLIRRLEVVEPADRVAVEEAETGARIAQAALAGLDELGREMDLPEDHLQHLRQRYQRRIDDHRGMRAADGGLDAALVRVGSRCWTPNGSSWSACTTSKGSARWCSAACAANLDVEQTCLDR